MSTSAISDAIVDIEGEAATPLGDDRRRGVALVFALCLAVGSAAVGRDGPEATAPDPTAPVDRPGMLMASTEEGVGQCVVVTFPDRTANELLTLPALTTVGATPDQQWVVRCTDSQASWLIFDRGGLASPLRVAGSRP